MPARDDILVVAGEWLLKAENDLRTAEHTLTLNIACPTDTVCFHAQQCVEKSLKVLLVLAGQDFPKTHDLEQLFAMLPAGVTVALSDEDLARLTDYATAARYPGWGPIPLEEAHAAVRIARLTWDTVQSTLPSSG